MLLISWLISALRLNRDYDMVQAVLSVTLNTHAQLIMDTQNTQLLQLVKELRQQQRQCWSRLQSQIQHSLAVTRLLANMQQI